MFFFKERNVSYNITLVNYIKRLLSNKRVPIGDNGVQVMHFYQLCSEILNQEISYENEGIEYYDMVITETLSKIQAYKEKYDAILVDEGQDFSDDMFRIITSLLDKETNNLTITLDDNQNI